VSLESQLREQDRTLQQQNEQLTALNRTNETIREIDQALVQAETREEIDRTVCELLAADDRFKFAWIGTVDRQLILLIHGRGRDTNKGIWTAIPLRSLRQGRSSGPNRGDW